MANFKLASGRTLRQWQVCEPRRMVGMSPAAIEYALMDAQVDIMALVARIKRAIALAEEGMCHGLLADDKCREILEVLRMPEDGSFDRAADEIERDAVPTVTPVDTTPMYKALMEARVALLVVNSGASQKAIALIDAVLNAAPERARTTKGETE